MLDWSVWTDCALGGSWVALKKSDRTIQSLRFVIVMCFRECTHEYMLWDDPCPSPCKHLNLKAHNLIPGQGACGTSLKTLESRRRGGPLEAKAAPGSWTLLCHKGKTTTSQSCCHTEGFCHLCASQSWRTKSHPNWARITFFPHCSTRGFGHSTQQSLTHLCLSASGLQAPEGARASPWLVSSASLAPGSVIPLAIKCGMFASGIIGVGLQINLVSCLL